MGTLTNEWARKSRLMDELASMPQPTQEPIAVVASNKKSPVLTQDPEAMKRVEGLLHELFPYDGLDD